MAIDEAHDHDERESPPSARGRVVLIVVYAVLVAAVLAGGVGLVVVDAVLGSSRVDKYDDSVRQRYSFGQRIGPDGDTCWPENDREYNGTVFCDLVSIGGLHWDTGDVRVADAVDIFMGSGYLCLVDEDGAPWCWEWSSDVPPRPARVPQGVIFRRIVGADGLACGQTPDYVRVICWSVDVDQQSYQQGGRRFRDNLEWHMNRVWDDPPSFGAHQRETGRLGRFHAFTGADL